MDEDRREREKLTARPENLLELAVSTMIDKRLHGQHTMDLDTTEHQDPLPMLAAALSHGKGSKNVASPGVALGQSFQSSKRKGQSKGEGQKQRQIEGKEQGLDCQQPCGQRQGSFLATSSTDRFSEKPSSQWKRKKQKGFKGGTTKGTKWWRPGKTTGWDTGQ